MRRCAFLISLALIGCSAEQSAGSPHDNQTQSTSPSRGFLPVQLQTADGVRLAARYYARDNAKALILLFHQAGSNKNEYATIAPRLTNAGYAALAIDQRSGGDSFGGKNETVERLGKSGDYVSAMADLEAALAWAKSKNLPIILWGSSYSADHVIELAAKQPDKIVAVMSFSPDISVREAASKLQTPLFLTSAKQDDEIADAAALLKASPARFKTQYVPTTGGKHGSATLLLDRNPTGAEDNWRAVFQFLGRLPTSPPGNR